MQFENRYASYERKAAPSCGSPLSIKWCLGWTLSANVHFSTVVKFWDERDVKSRMFVTIYMTCPKSFVIFSGYCDIPKFLALLIVSSDIFIVLWSNSHPDNSFELQFLLVNFWGARFLPALSWYADRVAAFDITLKYCSTGLYQGQGLDTNKVDASDGLEHG